MSDLIIPKHSTVCRQAKAERAMEGLISWSKLNATQPLVTQHPFIALFGTAAEFLVVSRER